jgi:hypothetical protein
MPKGDNSKQLLALTLAIEKLVATPVAPVMPVAPVAPVAPVLPIVPTNSVDDIKVAVLENQMKVINNSVEKLSDKIDTLTIKIDNNYVKKEDFTPIKDTVESMRLWQAKVVGIALSSAVVVDYLFRFLTQPKV